MIKLNWAQIRNPEFNPTLGKILRAKMPYSSAKRVLEILTEVRNEQAKSDEMWTTISERFLEPVPGDEGMLRIREALPKEEKAEAAKTLEEFYSTPVEIQKARLVPEELAQVELSPVELIQLNGLIEEL